MCEHEFLCVAVGQAEDTLLLKEVRGQISALANKLHFALWPRSVRRDFPSTFFSVQLIALLYGIPDLEYQTDLLSLEPGEVKKKKVLGQDGSSVQMC